MTFHGIDRPLDAYTRALHEAGFVVEQLRQPRPDAEVVRPFFPRLARAARRPFFPAPALPAAPTSGQRPSIQRLRTSTSAEV